MYLKEKICKLNAVFKATGLNLHKLAIEVDELGHTDRIIKKNSTFSKK